MVSCYESVPKSVSALLAASVAYFGAHAQIQRMHERPAEPKPVPVQSTKIAQSAVRFAQLAESLPVTIQSTVHVKRTGNSPRVQTIMRGKSEAANSRTTLINEPEGVAQTITSIDSKDHRTSYTFMVNHPLSRSGKPIKRRVSDMFVSVVNRNASAALSIGYMDGSNLTHEREPEATAWHIVASTPSGSSEYMASKTAGEYNYDVLDSQTFTQATNYTSWLISQAAAQAATPKLPAAPFANPKQ